MRFFASSAFCRRGFASKAHVPRNPNFKADVARSFARQTYLESMGACLENVEAGAVEIACPKMPHLLQQHGFFHGAVTAAIADSAAGYAAMSLFDKDAGILTTEFKVNLLSPADGDTLVARGTVIKPGR